MRSKSKIETISSSVWLNGGVTYDVKQGYCIKADKGYFVGGVGGRLTFNSYDDLENSQGVKDLLNSDKHDFIGFWREDIGDGTYIIYVEPSEYISDKQEALKKAKYRNELAIYDNENEISIYINKK